jgi:hypothetical protein
VKTLLGLLTGVMQVMMTAALTTSGILAGAGLVCLIAAHFCRPRTAPARVQ